MAKHKEVKKLKDFFTGKDKWCQESYERSDGSCCLVGAINKCYGDRGHLVLATIANYIKRHTSIYGKSSYDVVVSYNDNNNRRFSDIQKLVNKLDI